MGEGKSWDENSSAVQNVLEMLRQDMEFDRGPGQVRSQRYGACLMKPVPENLYQPEPDKFYGIIGGRATILWWRLMLSIRCCSKVWLRVVERGVGF